MSMTVHVASDCEELCSRLNDQEQARSQFRFAWLGLQSFCVWSDPRLPRNTVRVDRFGKVTVYHLDELGNIVVRAHGDIPE